MEFVKVRRSKDQDRKVKEDIILLDIVTGESCPDDERGEILDESRFEIYQEIYKGRCNYDNIDEYAQLYERMATNEETSGDDGQLYISAIT